MDIMPLENTSTPDFSITTINYINTAVMPNSEVGRTKMPLKY